MADVLIYIIRRVFGPAQTASTRCTPLVIPQFVLTVLAVIVRSVCITGRRTGITNHLLNIEEVIIGRGAEPTSLDWYIPTGYYLATTTSLPLLGASEKWSKIQTSWDSQAGSV